MHTNNVLIQASVTGRHVRDAQADGAVQDGERRGVGGWTQVLQRGFIRHVASLHGTYNAGLLTFCEGLELRCVSDPRIDYCREGYV